MNDNNQVQLSNSSDITYIGVIYENYKNESRAPALIISSALLSLIGCCGICLNSAVIFVTIRSKLHGTCNFIIALACFCEVCHQFTHCFFFYVVTFGPRFIDFSLCIKLQIVSIFGLNALTLCLLGTAIDRLISTMFPLFYKLNNDKKARKIIHLSLFIAPIIAFGLYAASFFITHGEAYANQGLLVTCDITDTLYAEMGYFFVTCTGVLNVVTVVLYIFVWIGIRKNVQAANTQNKLFKSLLVIVFVNVGGYFLNLGLMYIGWTFLPWPWSLYEYELFGCLLNMAAASNALVLYRISSDYRAAFDQHILRPITCRSNSNKALVRRINLQQRPFAIPSTTNNTT